MSESEVTCPYCLVDFEVNTDDGTHYSDGEEQGDECPNCEKLLMIYSSCTWYREARAAQCLNDGNHKWSDWVSLTEREGQEFVRRRCEDCDERETKWRDKS